ncbi:MAG: hypothetical protein HZB71_08510 [Betaproteobacteria bacterium]|nr:hypothetical protein [Betaproteobacteria bacterium]
MANAVKTIAKFVRNNPESESTPVLHDLCTALESEGVFELGRIYQLDKKAFEMAIELLEEWRFDRHVVERRLQKYLDKADDES